MNTFGFGPPVAILVAGSILVISDGDTAPGAGVVLIGVTVLVALFKACVRLSISARPLATANRRPGPTSTARPMATRQP